MNLETCSETEFARILEDVYGELRNSKGELYKRASYLCLHASLQHHIAELGRPFNICSIEPTGCLKEF